MNKRVVIAVIIIAVFCTCTLAYLFKPEENNDLSSRKFAAWINGESYQCDSIEAKDYHITLIDCYGYTEDVELIGGQDWKTLTIEVMK